MAHLRRKLKSMDLDADSEEWVSKTIGYVSKWCAFFSPLNGLFGAQKRHAILRQIHYISYIS